MIYTQLLIAKISGLCAKTRAANSCRPGRRQPSEGRFNSHGNETISSWVIADISAHEIVFPSWSNRQTDGHRRGTSGVNRAVFGQGVMDDDDWSFRLLGQINGSQWVVLYLTGRGRGEKEAHQTERFGPHPGNGGRDPSQIPGGTIHSFPPWKSIRRTSKNVSPFSFFHMWQIGPREKDCRCPALAGARKHLEKATCFSQPADRAISMSQ